MEHLKKQGYSLQVPIREVKYEVADHLGADKRTVDKYLQKIVQFGLMKLVNPAIMEFCGVREIVPVKNSLERFLIVEAEEDEPP